MNTSIKEIASMIPLFLSLLRDARIVEIESYNRLFTVLIKNKTENGKLDVIPTFTMKSADLVMHGKPVSSIEDLLLTTYEYIRTYEYFSWIYNQKTAEQVFNVMTDVNLLSMLGALYNYYKPPIFKIGDGYWSEVGIYITTDDKNIFDMSIIFTVLICPRDCVFSLYKMNAISKTDSQHLNLIQSSSFDIVTRYLGDETFAVKIPGGIKNKLRENLNNFCLVFDAKSPAGSVSILCKEGFMPTLEDFSYVRTLHLIYPTVNLLAIENCKASKLFQKLRNEGRLYFNSPDFQSLELTGTYLEFIKETFGIFSEQEDYIELWMK
jgi:hypothetical protein